jgi:hypothetical protein
MLFIGGAGGGVWVSSIWDIDVNSPSIEGFYVCMATFFVHPFGIWVGTSMSFSGGGTSPPHWANNAFTHGCAPEHTTTPTYPLSSHW